MQVSCNLCLILHHGDALVLSLEEMVFKYWPAFLESLFVRALSRGVPVSRIPPWRGQSCSPEAHGHNLAVCPATFSFDTPQSLWPPQPRLPTTFPLLRPFLLDSTRLSSTPFLVGASHNISNPTCLGYGNRLIRLVTKLSLLDSLLRLFTTELKMNYGLWAVSFEAVRNIVVSLFCLSLFLGESNVKHK